MLVEDISVKKGDNFFWKKEFWRKTKVKKSKRNAKIESRNREMQKKGNEKWILIVTDEEMAWESFERVKGSYYVCKDFTNRWSDKRMIQNIGWRRTRRKGGIGQRRKNIGYVKMAWKRKNTFEKFTIKAWKSKKIGGLK